MSWTIDLIVFWLSGVGVGVLIGAVAVCVLINHEVERNR